MNENDKACGTGIAIRVACPDFKYNGTFMEDVPHGICKSFCLSTTELTNFFQVNTRIVLVSDGKVNGEEERNMEKLLSSASKFIIHPLEKLFSGLIYNFTYKEGAL